MTALSPASIETGALERNRLLRAMPGAVRDRLFAGAEVAELAPGAVLQRENEPVRQVVFPLTGIISLVSPVGMRGVEAGTVGNEGFGGVAALLGGGALPFRELVQVPGLFASVDATEFVEAVDADPDVRSLCDRFLQFLLTQIAQSVACNRAHDIEPRCARWLLMTHDRVPGDDFLLKQEFLAQMLGVRRAGVSEAASALQRRNLIRYSRGRITIVDRKGLEAAACVCHAIVRRELDRLLG